MALSDYYLCDECGAKTFCDASLSYDDSNANPDTMHPWPDNVGWMRVLCHGCAEAARSDSDDTHPKATPSQADVDALVKAATEFLDSLDAVDTEAERAQQPGANAWSSAPVVRSLYARKATHAALTPFQKG